MGQRAATSTYAQLAVGSACPDSLRRTRRGPVLRLQHARTGAVLVAISSTWSSWRRRSPAMASASAGSKPSIFMDIAEHGARLRCGACRQDQWNAPSCLVPPQPRRGRLPTGPRGGGYMRFSTTSDDDGQVGAVVAPGLQRQHAAVAERVGERRQPAPRRARGNAAARSAACMRIASTLSAPHCRMNNWLELLQVRGHPRPDRGDTPHRRPRAAAAR